MCVLYFWILVSIVCNLGLGGIGGVWSGECGVRSVENAEFRNRGVSKMGSVENEECGKCAV